MDNEELAHSCEVLAGQYGFIELVPLSYNNGPYPEPREWVHFSKVRRMYFGDRSPGYGGSIARLYVMLDEPRNPRNNDPYYDWREVKVQD